MAALEKVGISAFYVPLNDIATEQGKIGGAAQKRLANGGMLHHVTMSYDIDADKMVEVLRIGKEKLSDKGTTSAKKRVDPLRRQTGLARAEIVAAMMDVFTERYGATPSRTHRRGTGDRPRAGWKRSSAPRSGCTGCPKHAFSSPSASCSVTGRFEPRQRAVTEHSMVPAGTAPGPSGRGAGGCAVR